MIREEPTVVGLTKEPRETWLWLQGKEVRKRRVRCKAVAKAGSQRPRLIIVKINWGQLESETGLEVGKN